MIMVRVVVGGGVLKVVAIVGVRAGVGVLAIGEVGVAAVHTYQSP